MFQLRKDIPIVTRKGIWVTTTRKISAGISGRRRRRRRPFSLAAAFLRAVAMLPGAAGGVLVTVDMWGLRGSVRGGTAGGVRPAPSGLFLTSDCYFFLAETASASFCEASTASWTVF